MFKISTVKINTTNGDAIYDFRKLTYIYGFNNKGKTAFLKLLDYLLGSSSITLNLIPGLDNIIGSEITLKNEKNTLHLKRTNTNYYYKFFEEDQYIETDRDRYLNEISLLTYNGETPDLNDYKEVFEEQLTFRAFTFLNFIDEKGLGDLSIVFTKSRESKNMYRIKNVMSFLFNRENIKSLSIHKKKLKEHKEDYKKLSLEKARYEISYKFIEIGFKKLNLKFSADIKENYNTFLNYSISFERNIPPESIDNDLSYLIKVSYTLSEQIKIIKNNMKQVEKYTTREKQKNQVLNYFMELCASSDLYSKYTSEVIKIIDKNTTNIAIMSSNDFESSIEELQERKRNVDAKIEKLSKALSINKYEETKKILVSIEDNFNSIKQFSNIDKIAELEKSISEEESLIQKLQKSIDEINVTKLNAYINDIYSELKNLSYCKEDFEMKGFKIEFNPSHCSLKGSIIDNKFIDQERRKTYYPGSMARQTAWQLCTYCAMFKYLNEIFEGVTPCLPLLIVDSLHQPFDDYKPIFDFLRKQCNDIGIQLVDISVIIPSTLGLSLKTDYIDITKGLNPGHINKKD